MNSMEIAYKEYEEELYMIMGLGILSKESHPLFNKILSSGIAKEIFAAGYEACKKLGE